MMSQKMKMSLISEEMIIFGLIRCERPDENLIRKWNLWLII